MKIAVLYGGRSREREISLKTGAAVADALRSRGHEVCLIDWSADALSELIEAAVEAVFIALHGGDGEGGVVQGVLETLRLPYTGSGVLASALSMDKIQSKRLADWDNIPTPKWVCWSRDETKTAIVNKRPPPISLPCVVKPSEEGSSVGVSLVHSEDNFTTALQVALEGRGEILIETFIDGPEVSVAVINGEALGVCEICPGDEFYSFEAKYQRQDTRYLLPTSLGETLESQCKVLAERCYHLMGCRGVARIDFMVEERVRPLFLEANTIPGMTGASLVPKIAASIGISFEALVEDAVMNAALDD